MSRGMKRRPTRPGQKAEMFWIDTRPTKIETGNTQKMVKALGVKSMSRYVQYEQEVVLTKHRD